MPAYFEKPLSHVTTKWRIFYEESAFLNPREERSDFEELRGVKESRIYRHGDDVLAVSSDNRRLQIKLRDLLVIPREPRPVNEWWGKGEPSHLPRAKTGSVLLFADEMLNVVAEAIKARKKVSLTAEETEVRRERMRKMRYEQLRKRRLAQLGRVKNQETAA